MDRWYVRLALVMVVWLLVILILVRTIHPRIEPLPVRHYHNQSSPTHPACNTTIISAYYRIPSKHSHKEYLAWMENFLSLKDCMVIFCSPELQDTLRSLRPSTYPALVLPRPMESFLMSRLLSEDDWAQQERLDPEGNPGHNRLLYQVWNEKTNMMKIVADFNPFGSSYFVWLDIGAVRHSQFNHRQLVRVRPADPGVLLLSMKQFTQAELEQGMQADFSKVNRLGGGTIGSGPESLAVWHSSYYAMVERYRASGRFLGKDQSVMASTCLQSGLCLLIQSDNGDWFRMQDWFRGDITTNYVRI